MIWITCKTVPVIKIKLRTRNKTILWENEQPINADNDITEEKTVEHEEQNAKAEDMQVEQQSGNDDTNIEEKSRR